MFRIAYFAFFHFLCSYFRTHNIASKQSSPSQGSWEEANFRKNSARSKMEAIFWGGEITLQRLANCVINGAQFFGGAFMEPSHRNLILMEVPFKQVRQGIGKYSGSDIFSGKFPISWRPNRIFFLCQQPSSSRSDRRPSPLRRCSSQPACSTSGSPLPGASGFSPVRDQISSP